MYMWLENYKPIFLAFAETEEQARDYILKEKEYFINNDIELLAKPPNKIVPVPKGIVIQIINLQTVLDIID